MRFSVEKWRNNVKSRTACAFYLLYSHFIHFFNFFFFSLLTRHVAVAQISFFYLHIFVLNISRSSIKQALRKKSKFKEVEEKKNSFIFPLPNRNEQWTREKTRNYLEMSHRHSSTNSTHSLCRRRRSWKIYSISLRHYFCS